MSNTPIQDPPAWPLSSSSGYSLPSRPLQPVSDPSASKRVYFYKSGDHKFSGHRMVINTRTFKTFDALLDVLSKKVPLPFGVRTITTPRGSHLVKALDDFHDRGSYVCSDQKRVKPLNLDEVTRRQVPWNTTRPLSNRQRRRQAQQFGQFGRRNEVASTRPAKFTERVAVRTPKRLVVIRNKDPTVKRTIVLQKRIAPTFDALLDYLSQILQFPVLKLFSTDGRRVDGLAGLILCSGIVVAAGNEPFRLGNYSFQGAGQIAQVMHIDTVEPSVWQPRTQNNKPSSSGRGSRNFSLSSERYIVNQINQSRNGNTNLDHLSRSFEPEVDYRHTSLETRGTGRVDDERRTCLVPQDDDIEKSFRVNQDGSMTVEMKVHLTIKEEEMLHWTTTLSRSSLSKGTVCASITGLGNSSPDSNNVIAKDSSASEDETKEENHPARAGSGVKFINEQEYAGYTSTALGKAKSGFKRTPTPGPRHVSKKASVGSVKMVTESGVQENTMGHYTYMERTADGETTEGYCVVRHSSGSSNRPIPKPRKTVSAGASNKEPHSSIRLSGAAEVLQIQNNSMEVTETVMHIYETQGCYDNYFANEENSTDGVTLHGSSPVPGSKPSTDRRRSSSNDCDFSWEPPATDSLQTPKEEMLSLSSEPIMPTHESTATKVKKSKSEMKRKIVKPAQNQKSSISTSSSDKKQKESIASAHKNSKHSSTDKLSSNTSVGKKTLSSSESGQKRRGAAKPQIKKAKENEKTVRKEPGLLVDTNVRRTLPKRQNLIKAARDNGHNVDSPAARPQMKKNMSDILQPKKSLLPVKKTKNKPKSMSEDRMPSPQKSLELSGNSMPSLNPSPSEIHQYVENWLDKVSPDPVPYAEDTIADVTEPSTNVVFQIGGGSESDEKSECRTPLHELCPSAKDAVKKSASCLSVPLEATALPHSEHEQHFRGSCVSMPSVRVDPVHENTLRPHKSTEAIFPAYNEPYPSNRLDPKMHTKHVLRELYSSIHCITSESETKTTPNLEKSSSLPDFSTQVAAVFGSSYKAFISFLSVMTLRDNLSGPAVEGSNQSRSTSEAMLMIESLQKISAIEDEEELRASLTDLQSRASSQLRERWKDFQILRERLESEPLSPKVSETEFALDVFSEGGDAFEDIDELMDELNMPPDLRAEISATIQQAKSFYPVDESTFVETERNQSDSEGDVEQFAEECNNDIKQSPESDAASTAEDISQTLQSESNEERGNLEEMQSGQEEAMNESELESASQTKRNEEDRTEEEQMEEAQEVETDREDGYIRKIDADCDGKEAEKGGREEVAEETEVDYREREESVEEEESVKEIEEMMTEDEEEEKDKLQGAEERLVDDEGQEERKDDSVEDEDEKVSVGEMKEGQDDVDDEEKEEQCKAEEGQGEETEEEEDGGIEESEGENIIEEAEGEEEEEDEGDADEIIGDTDEREEVGHIKEEEEEEEDAFKKDVEEEMDEVAEGIEEENNETDGYKEAIEYKCEEGEVENMIEEMEEDEEEEESDTIPEKCEETVVVEERSDEDEENIVGEKDRQDDKEVISGENNYEKDDEDEEVVKDCKVINIEEEEEGEGSDKSIEEEKSDEGGRSRNKMEETMNSPEEESEEEEDVLEETDKNIKEEEREDDEEGEKNEQLDEVQEGKLNDEDEEENSTDEGSTQCGTDCKDTLEEASYLEQQNSHHEANDAKVAEHNSESSTKYSSECVCEDDKDNGTDTVTGHETDEGGEPPQEGRSSLHHPVEISQELLDFVNSALQSSSLIFTYDARGNVRIEPESARVTQTKEIVIPKSRKDISYGLKRLPSPSTSDLSDYRPETSQSGGYKTQESVDIITDSGEEADICKGRTSVEGGNSKLSSASNREDMESSGLKSGRSLSSHDSGTKASKEDLSYFSAASSQKADAEPASSAPDRDSDGVLIDQGRWLLKENHLIRKSPPVSLGMYDHLDSTSVDTGQENTSEDSQSPCKSQGCNPLTAISSSELEEMAKPQTPKCAYYNMAHGSDSDPFMDDSSFKSGTKDPSSVKGRGVRVSPTIDTSKTWANKNGSLSSFASVEFKIPDGKVHPEGDSSSVTRTRRTSRGGRDELQAQDSQENLHLRCGQYCPIL